MKGKSHLWNSKTIDSTQESILARSVIGKVRRENCPLVMSMNFYLFFYPGGRRKGPQFLKVNLDGPKI